MLFAWGIDQEQAFRALKTAMTKPPVLRLPNFDIPFILQSDACAHGLGAVLMQQNQPIAYFNKSLGPRAMALSNYEKEVLGILETLKKWHHYLLGNKLTIKTDQKSLKFLSSQRLLEGIQHKLMLKLLEFDYVIEYKSSPSCASQYLENQQSISELGLKLRRTVIQHINLSCTIPWLAILSRTSSQDPTKSNKADRKQGADEQSPIESTTLPAHPPQDPQARRPSWESCSGHQEQEERRDQIAAIGVERGPRKANKKRTSGSGCAGERGPP
jgi:hypothetical protein